MMRSRYQKNTSQWVSVAFVQYISNLLIGGYIAWHCASSQLDYIKAVCLLSYCINSGLGFELLCRKIIDELRLGRNFADGLLFG